LQSLKVLVVDDNPHACDILTGHLAQFSFLAHACQDAKSAFELLESCPMDDPFRLVLMDYRMPEMNGLEAARYIKEDMSLVYVPKIILVTAASRTVDGETGLDVVDEVLAKPVNASLLLDAVMNVFGHPHRQRAHNHHRNATFDPGLLKPIQGARVLLVEDNAINRQVATELLEQAGLRVDVAVNGEDALNQVRSTAYDCILMDIQMPVMDGLTATARIRSSSELTQPPIVAITANVLVEDLAELIRAGMNDHIAKPIDPRALFSALLTWIPPGVRESIPGTHSNPAVDALPMPQGLDIIDHVTGLDLPKALRNIGGNLRLLRKLLEDFQHDHGGDLEVMRDALEHGDLSVVQRTAHTLKGVASTLGATQLQSAAAHLESKLRQKNTPASSAQVAERIDELELHMRPVLQALADLNWPEDKPLEGGSADPVAPGGDLSGQLDELAELLRQMNPDASERVHAFSALVAQRAQASTLELLREQTDNFEFELALETLATLRQECL
jgi:CheY-like chemotaxis protein